jgi:hypothetical protein
VPPKRRETPKPVERPLEGSRFAQLLIRIHGKSRAVEVANQVAASRGAAGDVATERVWRAIAAQVKRAPDPRRR